jgi:hypothetical protein
MTTPPATALNCTRAGSDLRNVVEVDLIFPCHGRVLMVERAKANSAPWCAGTFGTTGNSGSGVVQKLAARAGSPASAE